VTAALIGAVRLLPADLPRPTTGNFDIPGALIVTAGSSLVVFGLVSAPVAGWWSARGTGCLALGAVLLTGFVIVERRSRDPLVPPRLAENRGLVVATATIFVLQGTINALHYIYFLNLSEVMGYSALRSGLAFLPLSVFAIVGSGKLLPVLLRRLGIRRTLWLGILGTGLSMIALAAVMSTSTSYWPLLPVGLFWGVCAGATYPAIFAAVGSGVAPGEQGVASALASTSGQIGGAVGLAALVAVANAVTGTGAGDGGGAAVPDILAGLRTGVLVAGIVTIAVAFLPLALRKPQKPTYTPHQEGGQQNGQVGQSESVSVITH
jgi:MFS family permease